MVKVTLSGKNIFKETKENKSREYAVTIYGFLMEKSSPAGEAKLIVQMAQVCLTAWTDIVDIFKNSLYIYTPY